MIIQRYTLKTVYLCNHNIIIYTTRQIKASVHSTLSFVVFYHFWVQILFFGYNLDAVLLFVY